MANQKKTAKSPAKKGKLKVTDLEARSAGPKGGKVESGSEQLRTTQVWGDPHVNEKDGTAWG